MITGYYIQDTIKPKLVIHINTGNLIPDSVFRKLDEPPAFLRLDSGLKKRSSRISEVTITDTTSVCARNSIADITFYKPENVINYFGRIPAGQFPYQLAGKTASVRQGQAVTLIKDLRDGKEMPEKPLHHDWMIAVVLIAAYLYMIVRTRSRSILPEMARFLMFRGITESVSHDIGSVFTWQSTVLNFVSFLVIALFGYCAAEYYEFIPSGIPSFVFMLITLCVVIFGITSRHFICTSTGNLSGRAEAFNEYLFNVYQSYRFSSVVIFGIIVLLIYTVFFPPSFYFIIGLAVLVTFYAFRVLRLFLIFIKRDISILYLILYLCALEILPVLILLKYFTGLS
jgi:hypothetical protein